MPSPEIREILGEREIEKRPAWLRIETLSETVLQDEAEEEGRDQPMQRP